MFIVGKNLSKVYQLEGGEKVEALKGVNLEIRKGEIVGLMGPSGSGKSTLLNLLGGIDKPTKGEVLINGKNINNLKDRELAKFRNKNIGFVFQFHYLLPEFTALENVIIPTQFYRYMKPKDAEEKARNLLSKLNLEGRVYHRPSQMSGGEQQRVAIARAVINEPEIILADEPTGNLDTANTKVVMDIFTELNREKNITIVIATHDDFVASFCNRIIKLKDGVIEEEIIN
ncbi:MAG: lipoprotein-releasing system ATP-binding protein LolD [Persephonella sp.]|nr:MAG: lipoprotein-releasing system ATP-binding protein LolD [Persephonella sp.]RUM58857.1 MAG: lipoprotein-releasing system ATP-binding protein LolD [Persephonella sp.]